MSDSDELVFLPIAESPKIKGLFPSLEEFQRRVCANLMIPAAELRRLENPSRAAAEMFRSSWERTKTNC